MVKRRGRVEGGVEGVADEVDADENEGEDRLRKIHSTRPSKSSTTSPSSGATNPTPKSNGICSNSSSNESGSTNGYIVVVGPRHAFAPFFHKRAKTGHKERERRNSSPGKQAVVGGADHFLGVTVTKYSPQVFATAWSAAARTATITTSKARESYHLLEYNSITGPTKKGWQDLFSAVTRNGYAVTIAFFDRPATESEVKTRLILVAGQIMKVILALT